MAIPSSYPNAPALSSVFAIPSADQYAQNTEYWDNYKTEQSHVTSDCPSATDIPEWSTYHSVVLQSLPPSQPWETAAVGRNQCVLDASNWEWNYNPQSGRNKVFGQEEVN